MKKRREKERLAERKAGWQISGAARGGKAAGHLLRGMAAGLLGIACLAAAGCNTANQTGVGSESTGAGSAGTFGETVITAADSGFAIDGAGASASGAVLTISRGGSYRLSGTVSDGRILVDAGDEDVTLILDGFSISSSDFSPIFGEQCKSLTILLEEGSENAVSDGTAYVYTEAGADEPNAAIFSKDDLVLDGEGSLTVNGNYEEGIRGKDDVTIRSGTYVIEAVNDGIKGKDSVEMEGGNISITAGGDGIQSSNDSDAEKGYVKITGGELHITSTEKGIKSETLTEISGGTITVDAEDDAVHSNGDVKLAGGSLKLRSGDDAVHADNHLEVSGGIITAEESYEGLEGLSIDITGGTISIVSEDDGINAAGGADLSGNGGRGGDPFAVEEGAYIRIAGGEIRVNASGDGIDSNGDFLMEGGSVFVEGPLNGGNGIIDYNGTGTISGGTFVGTGSAGMFQSFSEASAQPVMIRFFETQKSRGTTVTVKAVGAEETAGEEGNAYLLEYTPEKDFSVLIFSSPQLSEGSTFQLACGEETAEISIEGIINHSGTQPAGGFGGGRGGHGRPGEERNGEWTPEAGRDRGERPGNGEAGGGMPPERKEEGMFERKGAAPSEAGEGASGNSEKE